MTNETLNLLIQSCAAVGIGLLIGAERERSHARQTGQKRHHGVAGIRTFALLSLTGNLLTLMPEPLRDITVAAGLIFTIGIAWLSYYRTSQGSLADKGYTTEVALVTTYILGALTGYGLAVEALMMAVIVLLLLHFKDILHEFSRSLSRDDIRQIIQFLLISIVVLPILPDRAYGPFHAFNPQQVWLMVVLVSGIGFAAYAAIKLLGTRAGLGVTGILGGIVSSTAVTLTMSRMTRTHTASTHAALLAIILACGAMFPRVLAYGLIFSPETAYHMLLPVGVITLFVAAIVAFLWRKAHSPGGSENYELKNPLSLRVALWFGALYGAVIFLSKLADAYFGQQGLFAVAALSGITDVDAITLSTVHMVQEGLDAGLAARVVLLACGVNTLVKLGIGIALAAPQARAGLIAGLAPMAAVCGAAFALG